ncbi:hypothetical protein ACWZHB_15905 [Nocardia sp. FBN12]|uniref:hypothetical protein n=1 Tax=Nocardia sp. FBN12 TaxID=3419766 RepID=UPI003D0912E8
MSHTRLLDGWRLVRLPAILGAIYLALHWILAAVSARHGFGSPDGVGIGFSILVVALVALRIVLMVVVPAVLAYRVVLWLQAHLPRRDDAGSSVPPAR